MYPCISIGGAIVKLFDHQRDRISLMIEDAIIVLTPVILTLVGMLWFF